MSGMETVFNAGSLPALAYLVFKNFPQTTQSLDALLSDFLRSFRENVAKKLQQKIEKQMKEKGLSETRSVPPSIGVPLLQSALLEEDEALQDLWAHLLVNALDPSFDIGNIRCAFIDVIKGLSPLDAKILLYWKKNLEKESSWPIPTDEKTPYFNEKATMGALGIQKSLYDVSIHNLMRVQCVTPFQFDNGVMVGDTPLVTSTGVRDVTLTPFGTAFITACIG